MPCYPSPTPIVSTPTDSEHPMGSLFNPDTRSMLGAGSWGVGPSPRQRRYHHPDFDKKGLQGWRAVHREASLPQTAWKTEREWAIRMAWRGQTASKTEASRPSREVNYRIMP